MIKVNTTINAFPMTTAVDPYAVWHICEACEWTGPRVDMKSSHLEPHKYKNYCPECYSNRTRTLAELRASASHTATEIEAFKRKPLHVQAEFSNALEMRLLRIQRLLNVLSFEANVNA